MKWFKYVRRGLACVGLLADTLPVALADGKLTIKEMAEIVGGICKICNWDVDIKIPPDVMETVVGITGQAPD